MFTLNKHSISAIALGLCSSILLFICVMKFTSISKIEKFLSPIAMTFAPLQPLKEGKAGKEVFGFLPSWNAHKTGSINFEVLTTLAYFDLKVAADGSIIKDDSYRTFQSREMTRVFKKAHANGTRVVATLTMMEGYEIEGFLNDPVAQRQLINESVRLVETRGIDGINVDFEYFGGAGAEYRPRFTSFVDVLTQKMHAAVPNSKVSVSLYASVKIAPRIYDLGAIAKVTDQIFMMAYDFATLSSEQAMPTAPLYGHNKNRWWYDVSTAVDDFLTVMPAEKLILGNPYYNLNFPVVHPEMKAATLSAYYGGAEHLTIEADKRIVTPEMEGVTQFVTGWDDDAKVGWKAYYRPSSGWRMSFTEDSRSLSAKYDFANSRNLLGVGMWALGNDGNTTELWDLIKEKFGAKLADNTVINKIIREGDHI